MAKINLYSVYAEQRSYIYMQVTNSTNLNFKAVTFTPRALAAMSQKLSSGKFVFIQKDMLTKYKQSPLDIVIDTISDESIRLCATFKPKNSVSNVRMTRTYQEETIFSSIFNRSEKFFKKLCKTINEQEQLILGKKA